MAHAKGRDEMGNFVAAGKGIIPFDYFIQRLQSIGFKGPLVAHGLEEEDSVEVGRFLGSFQD